MVIRYAILGLLSWQPCSGYDLKKIISDSTAFFWSGNNNQVYTTLVQLHKDGMVEYTVQPQESHPAKKIYSITDLGRETLKQWVLSTPDLPELHHTFLIQLSWADQLSPGELDDLLTRYEEEVHIQLLMEQEKARRSAPPNRTPRESFLWQKIADNITGAFENELTWIHSLRQGLEKFT